MNYSLRTVALVIAAGLALAAPANAQWQVPNHAVPIGQGGGNIGFDNAAPGVAGLPLISGGASVDPTFAALPNAGLANAPASTVKCNPTGGTAAVQDCTASQVSALLASTAVQVLPFTVTNANTPCGGTINVANGPGTLTLSSAAGFAAQCSVQVCNTAPNDASHHGFTILGFPAPSLGHLWMGQCETVVSNGSVWTVSGFPGKFRPSFTPTLYVDTSGSDLNDGLVSNAAASALRNPQKCFDLYKSEFDFGTSGAPSPPLCSLTAGQVFNSGVNCTNMGTTSVYYLVGNGGFATIRNTGGNVVVMESDFCGYIIFDAVNLDCTAAASHPCYPLYIHQQNGADLSTGGFTSGVRLTGANSGDMGVWCDGMCKINANQVPPTFTGTFGTLLWMDLGSVFSVNNGLIIDNSTIVSGSAFQITKNSQLIWSGPLTLGTANSVGQLFSATNQSTVLVSSNFSVTGSIGGGGRQWSILNNALLCNASGTAIPGVAGINSATGWANGIIAAPTLGGCVP